MKKLIYLLILSLIFVPWTYGQDPLEEETEKEPIIYREKKGVFIVLPVVYYSPETSLAFGGAGSYTWNNRLDSFFDYANQVQGVGLYTLKKQLRIKVPIELFTRGAEYQFEISPGYNDYLFEYYGIGMETKEEDEEDFSARFPELEAAVRKRLGGNFFVGIQFGIENYNIYELKEGGLLDSLEPPGKAGGATVWAGPTLILDKRNHRYFPTDGFYIESQLDIASEGLGGDYNFTRFEATYSTYHTISEGHIIAGELYGEFISGTPPFYRLALYGGDIRARGIKKGRYRLKNLVNIQGEYRFPLFWRLRGAAFLSYGGVFGEYNNIVQDFSPADLTLSGGGGIRFLADRKNKIYIRGDFGVSKAGTGFYFTVGEAF